MREFGQFNFSANLEVKKTAPLDARVVVAAKSELFSPATWTDGDGKVWLYNGLVVAAVDVHGLFMLVDADNYTQETSWIAVDASAAQLEVINNLVSTSTTAALAANQGKVLNDKIDQIRASIVSAYVFKGSVATYADLPTEGLSAGDVYNVEAAYNNIPAGTNFAWTGETWDALAGSVDLSAYSTTEEVEEMISGAVNTATSSLMAKIDGNTSAISSLNEIVASNKSTLQASIDDVSAKVVAIEEKLDDSSEGSIAYTVNNLVSVLGTSEGGIVKDVEDLKSGQSALQAAVSSLQTDLKVKDVDTTPASGISLKLDNGVVGIDLDLPTLNAAIEHPTYTANKTTLGVDLTGSVNLTSEDTISDALQALSTNLSNLSSKAITGLTSPNETLNIEGSGNNRTITVNTAGLVALNSAIAVVDNKIDLIWIEA